MAESQDMISPFAANQIRERDGEKLISYGTSSYGYDVRCADEFKVFTNIHSAVVDPKAFRRQKLRGHSVGCLHHSTELLCSRRTVEYFIIPEDV